MESIVRVKVYVEEIDVHVLLMRRRPCQFFSTPQRLEYFNDSNHAVASWAKAVSYETELELLGSSAGSEVCLFKRRVAAEFVESNTLPP